MSIAYVVKMFPRISETFVTNEIRELERRGIYLHPVSLMRPSETRTWDEVADLVHRVDYLPDPSRKEEWGAIARDHLAMFRRRPGRYLLTLMRVACRFSRSAWKRFFQAGCLGRRCEDRGVTQIHAAFAHTPCSVAFWVRRLTGIPYSFTAHAKDLYLSEPRSIRNKMDAARFVWTCTEANRAYLQSLGSRTPVGVAYHGIDLVAFGGEGTSRVEPQASGASRPARILCVARLAPKKGLPHLMRAASLLAQRRVEPLEVVLVGSGPEQKRLVDLARALDVSDRVRFLGSLVPSEVRAQYAEADVVVLPSVILENGDRDGIPNVLIEAMAMGVPVVSTSVSAIPELVRDGETGWLVAPADAEALAGAIKDVLRRPEEAGRRAEAARRDVRARFDLRVNGERLAARFSPAEPERLLYVTADFGVPVRGHKGASAHVRQIAACFAEAGTGVRVLTANAGPVPPDGNEFPLPVEELRPFPRLVRWIDRLPKDAKPRQAARELLRLAYNFALGARVLTVLRSWRPDLAYERYSLCSVATGILCRVRRVPWFLEVNAPLADEEREFRRLRFVRLTRALERWCLRRADHVFVVSGALRRWALELGVHPDRVSILPNGVDRRRFHPALEIDGVRESWGAGPGETVFAFAGSLKPWHGARALVDAFARLRAAGVPARLILIGDGPERKALEKQIRARGIDEFAHLIGAVPHAVLPRLLRAADVLVAPYLPRSRFYFSPLKLLEYLAVGRPVVASRIGEIPDLLGHGCGRLVRPGNVEELAAAFQELALLPDLRARLGTEASVRVEGHDWSDRAAVIRRTLKERLGLVEKTPSERIGYVLKMFPRFSETFIANEILELERLGSDVHVFSMKRPTGPQQEAIERVRACRTVLPSPVRFLAPAVLQANLRAFGRHPRGYLHALRFAVSRWDRRALVKLVQAGVVADACARERIGHLHAHFASGPARVAKMASMIAGVPFSFTAHAKDLYWEGHRHGTSNKLKKRVQSARFVVTVSDENKRFIEGQGFKVKEGRVRTIHIGLPLEDFPFRLPSDRPRSPRPVVLAVGRLIEKKGFHILVEAVARLRDRGVLLRCLIAGEGPERSRLEAQIARLRLSGYVKLLGPLPLDRLRRCYYARARVLAQPCVVAADGDRDGIPTVLLEAMALGVPVISTRVSGIPEAIEDGVTGYLTEPGDAGALADRIALILADVALADRLARAGRLRVEEEFDLRKNTGALRKLFLRSVAGWPPRIAAGPTPTEPATAGAALATATRGFPSPAPANIGGSIASLAGGTAEEGCGGVSVDDRGEVFGASGGQR